jgi:hypothetical protein
MKNDAFPHFQLGMEILFVFFALKDLKDVLNASKNEVHV